uniref:VIT family protein n=1 Tax=Rhizochromulina marina TaxID=1034831 RepID=A0A7S2W1U3_9STRA
MSQLKQREGPISPSRDLGLAREAYAVGDVELMVAAHDKAHGADEKHAGEAGEFIKSLVFGGLDGIITTFAIVSAALGANLGYKTVVVMGLANLIADAISMGLGDALSEKAELDYTMREYRREQWEFDENQEGEVREMIELYMAKGIAQEDAEEILQRMVKYREFFLSHMMNVELGLLTPDGDEDPWKKGGVTFLAFIIFGSIPLISYIGFAAVPGNTPAALFGYCIVFTGAAIFVLGVVKGKFAQADAVSSGLLMLVNGCLAAAASFLIGWGLDQLVVSE